MSTYAELRAFYTPQLPGSDNQIVKLTFDINYGYVPSKQVQEAIDYMQRTAMMVQMGMHVYTPLELLGIGLIMDRFDQETGKKT